VHHPIRRGLISLAAVAAALVPLSAAQGGAFSGDNGPIAFTCGSDVCKINPDGSGRTTLVLGASDPSWSSDETQIAYVSSASGVAVANANGTSPVSLFAGATSTQPSYSFSGARVAYSKAGDIYTILANTGGSETQITTTGTAADPAYSPDGTRIAYADSTGGTGFDIWTIPATGGARVHVTTGVAGNEREPSYSPDGSTIVYSSAGELFKVSSNASSVPQDLGVAGSAPAYSPDGTKIAFINAAGHLAVMSASGSGAVALTSTADAQPDWQSVDFASGPPRNLSYPTINVASGDPGPIVGHFLTSSVGSWEGAFPISYKYQWKRCDAADPVNGTCVDIAGAISSFYTPVAADVGKRMRLQVTASNSLGTTAQNSEVTAPVTAIAPKLRVTPQIAGGNVVDAPLSLVGAVWDGSTPLAFTYSWRRCNPVGDLATCVEIPGATLATYTPTVADIGFSIRVWLTATNAQGADSGITNHTFPIVDKPHFAPTANFSPSVGGTPGIGRQLTANVGQYTGDAPIASAFVWQRCDATGGACRVIPGAKKVVYFPTAADVGFTVRITVTATNAYGKLVVQSDPTETVAGVPPHRRGRHIVGTRRADYLPGGGYDDVILGLGGNDTILGGAGDDRIDGGKGNDVITGGAGADRLFGGPGSDTIYAADGERDIIDCGAGRDRVIADSFDKVVNCEVVASPAAKP
jgi:RTX calcium-binding nonapeptide repeat (4 copies)/WD40-like Beta Propeller Repeat